ncbi:helix-turn-helix domain-containing protein [Nocardia otitidiscaviarum]|uniref:helix-turn-helix domain-containing protein n=1 Tax=Nocardia otitidiscaviarum TaxID=1823 RepID=UPI0011C0299E|nr:AraC family transcriptional regulator [Nocardia otitidiscaviarum]
MTTPMSGKSRLTARSASCYTTLTDATQAEHYLRDTDIPLGRLATLLGYSEQAVFTRASRRWFGTTATDYRHTLREPPLQH